MQFYPFVDVVIKALHDVYPNLLIQFEDFSSEHVRILSYETAIKTELLINLPQFRDQNRPLIYLTNIETIPSALMMIFKAQAP
jgi:hypothetical protein